MTLDFDFTQIITCEFGVGLDETDGQSFCCVAIDGDVQFVLSEMAQATWNRMCELNDEPSQYEASEKYSGEEYIFLPNEDELAEKLKQLHEANNLEMNNLALADPSLLFCYFVRMTDGEGRHLTAVRRASQFKGILKSRLIRIVTDALKIVEDDVFKLDSNFDLIIDSINIHVLRPSSFEFVCHLQSAILEAAAENVTAIQADLPFVDFSSIKEYAGKHTRAARYLASIRSQELANIDANLLKQLCQSTNVQISAANGKIRVDDKHVLGFLEVLDRRRYGITLIKDSHESFRAPSRKRLSS